MFWTIVLKILIALAWVIGYLMVGVIAAIIANKAFDCQKNEAVYWVIAWPFGPFVLIFLLAASVTALIGEAGEMLWNWAEKKIGRS